MNSLKSHRINWLLSVLYLHLCVLSLGSGSCCRNPFQSHIFPSFFFCPHSDINTYWSCRSTNLKVAAFVDTAVLAGVFPPLTSIPYSVSYAVVAICRFISLSVYLSMSLCVCLAFCLSVWTSGCLPSSVSPPSVAWASVALHEMNALFPPGFRCGVPPGWRLPPSPQAPAHLQLQLDGCHVPWLLHGELHWGGELWHASKSVRPRSSPYSIYLHNKCKTVHLLFTQMCMCK